MKWFERGQLSFVFLYAINPIAILFYQNCAPSHLGYAQTESSSVLQESSSIQGLSSDSVSYRNKNCPEVVYRCPR